MAKAHAQGHPSQAEEDIRNAGEAMMLLISRSTWEVLLRQGAAEGLTPGAVLSKAIHEYMERHGSQEAVNYLHAVAEASR